jgi:hypothetical protein
MSVHIEFLHVRIELGSSQNDGAKAYRANRCILELLPEMYGIKATLYSAFFVTDTLRYVYYNLHIYVRAIGTTVSLRKPYCISRQAFIPTSALFYPMW